jgi:hypothetical protein
MRQRVGLVAWWEKPTLFFSSEALKSCSLHKSLVALHPDFFDLRWNRTGFEAHSITEECFMA